MNKKASMQLGINAIVVLIIALAILGLAMVFVTNLFKGGQSKLGDLIDRTDLPIHADASNPIMFESSDVDIKAGNTKKLVVSVYNTEFENNDVELSIDRCVDSAGGDVDQGKISLVAPPQTIPKGTDAGYSAIVSVNDELVKGTYICTVQAKGGDTVVSQQIYVNVVV